MYVDNKLPSEYERCLVGINSILKEAWDMSKGTEDKKERIQALSLAKECYSMITDLLTNVGVIREAMRFVTDKKKSSTKEESLNINKNRESETINKVF